MSCLKSLEVRTEYLEATLGLVKRLEISKELMLECVTVPGCCCCMPLLHNHLMDSCSYVRKNTLLAAKGGCICTPLTPLNPPLGPLYQKKALVFCVAMAMLFVSARYRTTPQRFEGNCSVRKYAALQHMKVELDTGLPLP